MLNTETLRATEAAHERLVGLERDLEQARTEFHQGIRRLHAAGATLREIAERFGLSHQRVHQIVGGARSRPKGATRDLRERIVHRLRDWSGFERFDRDARTVVDRAQNEARGLGHPQVGTEHVLLGLLRSPDGAAGRTLTELGVEHARIRAGVIEALGTGPRIDGTEPLPLTPRARRIFEQALHEALDLRDNFVGSEHILLGLVAETSGLAARLLRDLGADADRVRDQIRRGRRRPGGSLTP